MWMPQIDMRGRSPSAALSLTVMQPLTTSRADTDLPSESLTSCKRAFLAIQSYKWKLASPNRRRSADGRLELPIVVMEILDFEMKEGDRYWPHLHDETVDIGRGENDGEVQKVLRKWYFGEYVLLVFSGSSSS